MAGSRGDRRPHTLLVRLRTAELSRLPEDASTSFESSFVREIEGAEFDLVVADILMPEKDGLEFITFLGANRPETKVSAISAKDNALHLKNAEVLGADRTLTEPFDLDTLTDSAAELLKTP